MTLAGWLVVAGSVVVVVMAFSQVAELRSLETREAIEDYLSRPPGEDLLGHRAGGIPGSRTHRCWAVLIFLDEMAGTAHAAPDHV